jgi:hypothetical protein
MAQRSDSVTLRRSSRTVLWRWGPLGLALLAFGAALAIVAFGQ